MKSVAIPIAIFGYIVLTLFVPLVRHRLGEGRWPLASWSGGPVQRVIAVLLGTLLLAGGAWATLLVTTEAGRLGIWEVPAWVAGLGWGLLGVGTLLESAAQLNLGASFRVGVGAEPTALVTGGLYAWTRNPLFTGLLVSLAGVVLLAPAPWTVMGYLWIASLIVVQVRFEEEHLTRVHGDRYQRYASRVGRFFPLVGR